jgi:hypothetical protein
MRAIALKGRRRPVGPEGRVVPASGEGSFPGAGFWESNAFGLLLIIAYNYNLTTNNFTTETQSAQRLSSRAICCRLQLVILAGRWQQRRAAPSDVWFSAALFAAACGPGRAGLPRCHLGEPNARAVGHTCPGACCLRVRRLIPRACGIPLLLCPTA